MVKYSTYVLFIFNMSLNLLFVSNSIDFMEIYKKMFHKFHNLLIWIYVTSNARKYQLNYALNFTDGS